MLNPRQAADQVAELRPIAQGERAQLDVIRRYWKARQPLPTVIPPDSPPQVKAMARIARVNVCPIVVDSLAQATFVDGFRGAELPETRDSQRQDPVWRAWQANKMDARQTGLHRSTFAYRAAYTVVLPGDPYPVIRTVSPRSMTAFYGEDPDWPMWALERAGRGLWKLYDEQAVYYVSEEKRETALPGEDSYRFEFIEAREHGLDVVPVIRYLDEDDLDADDEVDDESGADRPTGGQVAPLMPLQDQIDLTTFGLLVAQWYQAFKQRYVIGWMPQSEQEAFKVGAARLMFFPDSPEGDNPVKVGEFTQADLDGYIQSRQSIMRYAATISQTPVHELVGELVNLAAEALVAAEQGHERKVGERKTLLGESHEQTLRLVGRIMGVDVPEDAQVVWRDTSARTFAATVDGLGKLATMLGVPAPELWERIPGVTQQDIARWKQEAQRGDSFTEMMALLNRQDRPAAAAA